MKIVGILYLAIIVSLSLPAQAQQFVRLERAPTTYSLRGENLQAPDRKLTETSNRDRLNRLDRVARDQGPTSAGVGEAIVIIHPGRPAATSAWRRYRRRIRASSTVGYFSAAVK